MATLKLLRNLFRQPNMSNKYRLQLYTRMCENRPTLHLPR